MVNKNEYKLTLTEAVNIINHQFIGSKTRQSNMCNKTWLRTGHSVGCWLRMMLCSHHHDDDDDHHHIYIAINYIRQRITFKIATLVHIVQHQDCPPYLCDLVHFTNADCNRSRLRSATSYFLFVYCYFYILYKPCKFSIL